MLTNSGIQLCPAQKRAFECLSSGLQVGSILGVWGGVGCGKTTILRELHQLEAVKGNKERYAAAEAQALARSQSLMPRFMRSFATSNVFNADRDGDD